jgi:integrase/recombinase XerD
MKREFFKSRFRIQQLRGGQDGHLLDVFTEDLRQSGFAQITARRHIRAAECRWRGAYEGGARLGMAR